MSLKIQAALKVAQTKADKDLQVFESDRIICEFSEMMSFTRVECGETKLDHPLKICWMLEYTFPSAEQTTFHRGFDFTDLGIQGQNLALKRFHCVICKVMEISPWFGWTGWPPKVS